jgi:RimJ/RimL family protein N-acetyltransferase
MFRDRESSKFLGADFTDEQQLAAMHERRLSYRGAPGTGHWIAELHSGAVVGLVHLRDSWELPGDVAEIGWYLDPNGLGKGYASEAAGRLIDYGLDELELPAIWALIHVCNTASQRVAQRLGMLQTGRGEHYGAPHLEWMIRRPKRAR